MYIRPHMTRSGALPSPPSPALNRRWSGPANWYWIRRFLPLSPITRFPPRIPDGAIASLAEDRAKDIETTIARGRWWRARHRWRFVTVLGGRRAEPSRGCGNRGSRDRRRDESGDRGTRGVYLRVSFPCNVSISLLWSTPFVCTALHLLYSRLIVCVPTRRKEPRVRTRCERPHPRLAPAAPVRSSIDSQRGRAAAHSIRRKVAKERNAGTRAARAERAKSLARASSEKEARESRGARGTVVSILHYAIRSLATAGDWRDFQHRNLYARFPSRAILGPRSRHVPRRRDKNLQLSPLSRCLSGSSVRLSVLCAACIISRSRGPVTVFLVRIWRPRRPSNGTFWLCRSRSYHVTVGGWGGQCRILWRARIGHFHTNHTHRHEQFDFPRERSHRFPR